MKWLPSSTLLTLILLSMPTVVFSQGTLQGVVTDSLTHETLIGINVLVEGTSLGNATNIEGQYKISGIPDRPVTIKVSCIGYLTKFIAVDFSKNNYVQLNVQLKQTILEGEAVVITAQMRGQLAAINQQITSNTIVNIVSEEKIKELPDANAAEAVGRLPGVSLLRSGGEANKVILRGMSDKFTTVTIDGVKIPPTDADSRGVDLSTITQGSLSGIELFKALTPDKDADAIAGSVNFVTRRAPAVRTIQIDIKGDYNKLMNSANQYDLGIRYGERFFGDVLGVQVMGNIENRIRSNEQTTINYKDFYNPPNYFISNFKLQFIDEARKRDGLVFLLDYDTPDSGSVKLSTNYNRTEREYLTSLRNYPSNNSESTPVYYESRDRDQTISSFNSSLRGENHFMGITFNWGGAFAQSLAEYPFDYYVDFYESQGRRDSTGRITSGMDLPPNLFIKSNPEVLIPYAVNNFQATTLDSGIFTYQKNREIEKTGFLDAKSSKYVVGDLASGELKLGGKYKYTMRFKEASRLFAPYYLGFAWQPKNLLDSRFRGFYLRYLLNSQVRTPLLSDFVDNSPVSRDLFDKYRLYPLMNKDAVHEWYDINRNGTAPANEYYTDNTADLDYYDITERIAAVYLMNTLNVGQDITFIAGVRIESESNDYKSRFVPGAGSLGGFPTPSGQTKDTTTKYTETIWLPNFHLVLRPTEFMNVRLAAYKALARPDFNARLIKLYGVGAGTGSQVYLGNPTLRDSKAWNYEVSTSFFSDLIGLVTVSAYYKDIKDDIHLLNGAGLSGHQFLDSLGIFWPTSLTNGGYQLTIPYNATSATHIWGFEFEHQANLGFLPGYFQFVVLSYNFSIVRSETHLVSTTIDTIKVLQHNDFGDYYIDTYANRIIDRKQKLEGQPEFFGNVAVGYDIGDFSARLSFYYQGEFNSSFSPGGLTDGVIGAYSRVDLTLKQKITPNIALLLSLSNLLDTQEKTYTINRVYNWRKLSTNQRYGATADFGVRVSF